MLNANYGKLECCPYFTKGEDFHFNLFDQGFLISVAGQTKHSLIKIPSVPDNCLTTSLFIIVKGKYKCSKTE